MNTRRFLLSLLLLTVSAVFAGDAKVTHADAKEAAKLVKAKKVLVIDVRTPAEYSEGHIDGAKNIDFRDNKFEAGLAALDKKQPVLVHCAAGGRSTSSLKVFEMLGFTNVTHLDGGLNAWKAEGLPVKK